MPSHDITGISELLDRYLLSLDDDELDDDWARSLFTENALVEFPISQHRGISGMAAWHRSALDAFAATQHLHSPAVVAVAGDRATLRANLMSTHVHRPEVSTGPPFMTGTFVTGEAHRTASGWRLASLAFRLVWMMGDPPRRPD